MKTNEYNAAEAVEIGKAEEVILGQKIDMHGLDSSGQPPIDRVYEE